MRKCARGASRLPPQILLCKDGRNATRRRPNLLSPLSSKVHEYSVLQTLALRRGSRACAPALAFAPRHTYHSPVNQQPLTTYSFYTELARLCPFRSFHPQPRTHTISFFSVTIYFFLAVAHLDIYSPSPFPPSPSCCLSSCHHAASPPSSS